MLDRDEIRGVLAHDSLRTVLTYTGSIIIDDAAVRITVERSAFGPDGLVDDPHIRAQILNVLTTLARS